MNLQQAHCSTSSSSSFSLCLQSLSWVVSSLRPSSWTNKMDSKVDATAGYLASSSWRSPSCSCLSLHRPDHRHTPCGGRRYIQFRFSGNWHVSVRTRARAPSLFFAMFPTMLKSMPKSGGWMNTVKVVLRLP